MFALYYIFTEDHETKEQLLAVSASIDSLMNYAREDAFGKGCDEVTDFEQCGNGYIARVTFNDDCDTMHAKYLIEHVVLVV